MYRAAAGCRANIALTVPTFVFSRIMPMHHPGLICSK